MTLASSSSRVGVRAFLTFKDRAKRVPLIEQQLKSKDAKLLPQFLKQDIMRNESNQRAAEFHELAAHAHRAAAAHHAKEDHQTGHEHSKQALGHANKGLACPQEAELRSSKSAGSS